MAAPEQPAEPLPAFIAHRGRAPRRMAPAIRCDELLREGVAERYADLAELDRGSRPRVTQVMSLLHLAPDIPEALLFLPRAEANGDPVLLRDLLSIAATLDWGRQRER